MGRFYILMLLLSSVACSRQLELVGELAAERTVKVFARASGQLVQVLAKESVTVKAGDLLAELDNRREVLDLQYSQATLAAAEARLEAMEQGLRPEEQIQAQADLDAAKAIQRNAAQAKQRIENLFKSGGASKELLDTTARELEVASARLLVAEKNQQMAELGPRVEEKRIARAEVAQRRIEVHRAELNLSYTRVLAPFSGVVVQRNVEPGDTVTAGTQPQAAPVCVLSQSAVLKAWIEIPERDLPFVRVGQVAELSVALHPNETFPATLTNVLPYVDKNTRMGRLEFIIDNHEQRLMAGLFATVKLKASLQPAKSAQDVLTGKVSHEPK